MVAVKDLREQIDTLQQQTRKLKKAVKIYSKRLKMTEGDDDDIYL